MKRALLEINQGDLASARGLVDAALALDPDVPHADDVRGYIQSRQGD